MIPLIFTDAGETNVIKKISGPPGIKKHLENLGFITGGDIILISIFGGNVIVKVKGARIAISQEMARKIMV